MTDDIVEQRSPEWFAARKGRVTGSMVGAILGLNPYMTPDDAMRAMVRELKGAPREFDGNVATRWGTMNEDGARAEYELETGNTVEKCGFFTHNDWLGASPDGLVGDEGLIEIKCPYGARDTGRFKTAEEQPHYYAQMQIQMFVAGKTWCDFYQWSTKGASLETIAIDDEFLIDALPKLYDFWQRLHKVEVNNSKYLEPKISEIDDQRGAQLIAEWDDASAEIKRLEERKKELLDALVLMSNGETTVICGRKLSRIQRKGNVNYAKVVEALLPNTNLDPWRGKPTEYWTLK